MNFDDLESFIPDNIIEKVDALSKLGAEESKKSLIVNRNITNLFAICHFFSKLGLEPLTLIRYASLPLHDVLECYTPMQAQSISYLIQTLYDDPTAFAVTLANIQNSP